MEEIKMSYLKEKVSYVKGLFDGMKIDETTNEGKLFKSIIDLLNEVALEMDDVEEVQESLSEQIDAIDEDLAEIEKDFYDEDDDYDDSIECPHCGEEFDIDEDVISEETLAIECPNCKEKIEINWDCDCDCDECEDEKED
jgi:DNA-directed RNA polymerase subunit RPC12/RpoP